MGDLKNAVEEFKKNIKNEKLKELKSIQDKGTIEVAVELAYDDAKRTMTGIGAHKDERKEAQGEIVEKLHSYFALSTAPDCNKFDELHKEMCELWHKRFEDIDNLGTYGKAQKIVSLALVGTMGVTSFATAALAAPNSVVTGTQVISALNATTDMKGLNRALEEFSRTYGNNIRDVVFDAVGYEEKAETRGIITQGAKAIAKVLRQFGDDIINLVRAYLKTQNCTKRQEKDIKGFYHRQYKEVIA